ncbi:hypothetical protein Plhal304r1_c015g0054491 [Plasmopara halstedii]
MTSTNAFLNEKAASVVSKRAESVTRHKYVLLECLGDLIVPKVLPNRKLLLQASQAPIALKGLILAYMSRHATRAFSEEHTDMPLPSTAAALGILRFLGTTLLLHEM